MMRAAKWGRQLKALTVYKEMHGDLLVPYRFIVPNGDERWPQETWGMALGNLVHKLRQSSSLGADRRSALEELGFVFDGLKTVISWPEKMLALANYKRVHDHLRVPMLYVVPDGDPQWPPPLWNLKLGSIVHKLRKTALSLSNERRLELVELGFVWTLKRKRTPDPPSLPPATPPPPSAPVLPTPPTPYLPLASYQSRLVPLQRKRRDTDLSSSISLQSQRLVAALAAVHRGPMPSKFRVPLGPPWPPEAQGLLVDIDVIRQGYKKGTLDADVVAALNAVHFTWNVRQYHWDHHVFALRLFRDLHGHANVPYRFVVPSGDDRWPTSLQGLHLGNVVHKWRQQAATLRADRRATLDAVGFVWGAGRSLISWADKMLALATYRAVHGHTRVPKTFVVPDDDRNWPPALWGMKLGGLVDKLRRRLDTLPTDQRAALVALGFVGKHGQPLRISDAPDDSISM
ncbi:hypothetical protein ACHHYP_12790 [Achlya hypogyna]|uniref:Helicase-associated domain-containing protein n=1 Tax=Achlya hypogyna TaxID=1202772 RepID=A0A1V9YGP1_ACHHY|nr:hypothetical protein ACHHYP_12790 [Achlya hypogyna]